MKHILFITLVLISLVKIQSRDFILEPNSELHLINPVGVPINLDCKLKGEDQSDEIRFKINKGKASFNGKNLESDQTLNVNMGSKAMISISSDLDALLSNLGKHSITADCDLVMLKNEKKKFLGDNLIEKYFKKKE